FYSVVWLNRRFRDRRHGQWAILLFAIGTWIIFGAFAFMYPYIATQKIGIYLGILQAILPLVLLIDFYFHDRDRSKKKALLFVLCLNALASYFFWQPQTSVVKLFNPSYRSELSKETESLKELNLSQYASGFNRLSGDVLTI